jgi:flavin reductase (DIM6/NTAB) family NADH-FMN oxidoreductase RutF
MARKHFSGGALTAPVPPVLVSVGGEDESNLITIGWTGILATSPPKTYISVRPERHSYAILKKTGEFVINLAPASLVKTVDFCGIYTGAKVDKFEKCALSRAKSNKVEAPTVAECPIALECRVCEVIPMGTHDVFIADIVSVSCDESVLDEQGKIRFDKADLLAYAHGEYYRLGEVLGAFGFSAAKKKKASAPPKSEEKTEAKRPFYLDLPKGKKRPKSGGVSKKRKNGGK